MPRPRTGTVEAFRRNGKVVLRARLRLADGSRPRVDLPEGMSEARARDYAERLQELEDANGALLAAKTRSAPKGESPASWFDRWHTDRQERGLRSVATDRARVRDYVLPHITSPTMALVTRAEVEDVRDALDRRIRKGTLAWKTCANAWGLVTKAFSDAVNSKRRSLRVREDNPTTGVLPPERGEHKTKAYLFPSEASALLGCEDIPPRWRRLFALTVYLYARPGEVRALTWGDVDLERGVVHIHKSIDRNTGLEKSTKTEGSRRVPLEAAVLPLLRAMRAEQGSNCPATARLVPWGATNRKLSLQLQRCLRLAGISRRDLFEGDDSRKAMTFYDLRATGITWCAVRGDDPLRIKQRAGHKGFATTEGYIREAENLREANFGSPFPAIPDGVVWPKEWSTNRVPRLRTQANSERKTVEAPGIESGHILDIAPLSSANLPSREPGFGKYPEAKCMIGGSVDRRLAQSAEAPKSAIEEALRRAAEAGQWETVERLALELGARRGMETGEAVSALLRGGNS